MPAAGRARGRYPLRGPAYKRPRRRRFQPSKTSSAQIISVGLVTETETPLAVTARKTRTLGQTAETSTAQTVTRVTGRTIGIATETGTAQTLAGKTKVKAVEQVTETDAALNVTGGIILTSGAGARRNASPRGRHRGRYPLRGSAWKTTPTRNLWVSPHTAATGIAVITVGQAAETDTALFLVAEPQIIPVGQAAETDTATTTLRSRRHKNGFPYPVDQVFAGPFVLVNQASATNTAQPVTRVKKLTLGIATEASFAQSVTGVGAKIVNAGIAVETDTAQTARPLRTRAIGLASETDTAQAAVHSKTRAIGLVIETGTAQTARPARIKAVGLVTATNTAQAITEVKGRTLGFASDAEVGLSPSKRKVKQLGQNTEADEARPVSKTGLKTIPVTTATETDTTTSLSKAKVHGVSLLQESQTAHAVAVIHPHNVQIGQATEADTAQTVILEGSDLPDIRWELDDPTTRWNQDPSTRWQLA